MLCIIFNFGGSCHIRSQAGQSHLSTHHGCTLGKLAQTREMMGRLAVLWDVPVTVAMGQQYIPRNPAEAMRFQGQTYTAYPGGSQRAWIARVLAGERTSR